MLESGTSGSERGQWSIGHGYINLNPRDPDLLAQDLFVAVFSFKSCVRFGASQQLSNFIMHHFSGLQIILQDGYSSDESKKMTSASRCLLNLVERHLHALKIESEFTKLNIYVSKTPANTELIRYKEPKHYAGVSTQFVMSNSKTTRQYNDQVIAILGSAIELASRHFPVPTAAISDAVQLFIDQGYKNEWIYGRKHWKTLNIDAEIHCEVQIDKFLLTHRVFRDSEQIASQVIASTQPREWLFYPLMGSQILSRGKIVLRDRKRRKLSEFDLESSTFKIG